MSDALHRTRSVLQVMRTGSGVATATINGVGAGEVRAVIDEMLDQQARGGRPVRGVRMDAALAHVLGCPATGPCSYRGVPVASGHNSGVVEATLEPRP